MILDEKFSYKITREDILEMYTNKTFSAASKVLQTYWDTESKRYRGHNAYATFMKYLKRNAKTLLLMDEETINSEVYHKVERLVEQFPEEFPSGYGWYSSKLIVNAFERGDLVWSS